VICLALVLPLDAMPSAERVKPPLAIFFIGISAFAPAFFLSFAQIYFLLLSHQL
jgi:hypothetical protein